MSKALREKAKRTQLSPHDIEAAKEHAAKLAREIYSQMKEAERARQAAKNIVPRTRRSKHRPRFPNPMEGVAGAIADKFRNRKMSGPKDSEGDRESRGSGRERGTSEDKSATESRAPREKRSLEFQDPKEHRAKRPSAFDNQSIKPRRFRKLQGLRNEKMAPTDVSSRRNQDIRKEREKKERLGPKINMRHPEVRGEKIDSKKKLHDLLNDEYSALKRKKDFPRRLKEAEVHLELLKRYSEKERLDYGDIAKIAKGLEADSQTVSNWLTKGMTPRLYTYMEWSTPRSVAEAKVRKIQESNNGIMNAQDVQRRLDNYYFGKEERESHSYKRDLGRMNKYFDFIERYRRGGFVNEIARQSGLSETGAREYLEGRKPWLVRLTSQIPAEQPAPGNIWMPTRTTGWGVREGFIEIPRRIESHHDILKVIRQLEPLNNKRMNELRREFGECAKDDAFMYVLGMFVSDSGVQSQSKSSQSFYLALSKSYKSSGKIGNATCYYLGLFGISASQVADLKAGSDFIESPRGRRKIQREAKYVWRSEASPVLRWVWNSVLGLGEGPKNDQQIDAKWILDAPRHMRVPFMQGLADGDGSASPRGRYLCVTTKHNQKFVQALFKTLGVESRITGTDVVSRGYENAKKAAAIPMFRFSKERIDAAEKTARMINAMRNVRMSPLKSEEVDFMVIMRKRGLSWYDIHEAVFDKFGTSIDRRTIERAVLRRESRNPAKSESQSKREGKRGNTLS